MPIGTALVTGEAIISPVDEVFIGLEIASKTAEELFKPTIKNPSNIK